MGERAGRPAHFAHICISLHHSERKRTMRKSKQFKLFSAWALVSVLMVAGCHNDASTKPKDLSGLPLYCDYRVTGDEESGKVTVLMQFRAGGPDGPGVLLTPPGSVHLDGYQMLPDSSRMFGVYYEQRWFLNEFAGPHQLSYVTAENDSLVEKFNYPIFNLLDTIPSVWRGDSLRIRIEGLKDDDSLHLLMLDTAFLSSGVDKCIALKNSELTIGSAEFSRLRTGPIILELYRDMERDLHQAEGRIACSYVVRRRFILQ